MERFTLKIRFAREINSCHQLIAEALSRLNFISEIGGILSSCLVERLSLLVLGLAGLDCDTLLEIEVAKASLCITHIHHLQDNVARLNSLLRVTVVDGHELESLDVELVVEHLVVG